MAAVLKIKESGGTTREFRLEPNAVYSIGRAQDNDIVLNDRRVSRKHAHIASDFSSFVLVDGVYEDGELKRSVNKVFVNGKPVLEKPLKEGDLLTIGTTQLSFHDVADAVWYVASRPAHVNVFEVDIMPTAQRDAFVVDREV